MAKYTVTISGNGDTQICNIKRPSGADNWVGTVFIYGTFGSGTITLQLSPNAGTTKITAKDSSGTAVTATANDIRVIPVSGTGSSNSENISIWVNMAGSTSPSVTVEVWDNI